MSRPYTRLPILIFAIIAITLLVAAITLSTIERRLLALSGEALSLAAADIADKLDLLFYERAGDIQIIAKSTAPSLVTRDFNALSNHLYAVQQAFPIYLWLGVTDRDGLVVAATNTTSVGKDRSQRLWFQQVRAQKQLYAENLRISEDAGGVLAIAFTAPIIGPQDEFLGVVTARIGLAVLGDLFFRTVRIFQAEHRISGSIEWEFLDRDGFVLSESGVSDAKSNLLNLAVPSARLSLDPAIGPGYVEEQHARRQVPVMTGYAHTNGYGRFVSPLLGVLVREDRSDILTPIRATIWKLGAAAGVVIMPLLGVLLWTTRRLRRAFDDLELRVQARTEELSTMNAALSAEIAERKQAEKQKARLAEILELTTDFVGIAGPDGRVSYINRPGRRLVGLAEDTDISGMTIPDFLPEQVWTLIKSEGLPTATQKGTWAGETVLLARDGREIQVSQVILAHKSTDGTVEFFSTIARDITERKQIERELREAEERFRLLVERALLGIYILDRDGRFLYVNPKMEEITGYTQDELLSSVMVMDLVAETDRSLVDMNIMKRLNGEIPNNAYGFKGRRKDGSLIDVEVYSNRIELHGAPAIIGMVRDMTQFNRMQADARQLERLTALGQLLGGIAHELKNPLFILTGHLQIAREKLRQRQYDDLPASCEKMQETAKRLTAIAERFLHLAAPVAVRQERCSVPAMLQEILDLVKGELTQHRISVNAVYAPDLPETWLVPGQVQEVLLNLVLNSIQAMAEAHGKGTLTVSAKLSASSDQPSVPEQEREQQWIEVRIQDDGPGVPPSLRTKIFEPFFTTKPPDKGTGLGLWIVRSNLMMLHGTVRVEAETGQGATFIVQLPVVTESPRPADPPPSGKSQPLDQD
nr:PAS domain S-box protein [Nitrospirota bacterium]